MNSVFSKSIELELERIPVLEVVCREEWDGRAFTVHQTISRNVFTAFDLKLSRHLAATAKRGFPSFRTDVEVREANPAGRRRTIASASHESVPHALLEIARRAVVRHGKAELTFNYHQKSGGKNGAVGPTRKLTEDDIEMMGAALKICHSLGESEFLQISGDFDILIVTPPGDLKPLTMILSKGKLTIPSSGDTPFECPIITFAESAARDSTAQHYLARVRHALVAEKEMAITQFRCAAEERILATNNALGGRGLDGHRLTAVESLVARLTAGLGSNLKGLAEDARITALDWRSPVAQIPAVASAAA